MSRLKTHFFLTLSLLLFVTTNLYAVQAPVIHSGPDEAAKAKLVEAYGKLPLYFIENKGQVDKKVKFYEKGSGHTTFFTKEGVYLSLSRSQKSKSKSEIQEGLMKNRQSEIVKLIPLGANKDPEIVAEGMQKGKVNYFIGKDPKKWKTNIHTYKAVVYKKVYKGVDIRFYGNNRQLEYDIIVKQGADPSIIRLL